MRKSPGKWIKAILFGKKSSKSAFAKDSTTQKKSSIAAKAPLEELAVNHSMISRQISHEGGQDMQVERVTTPDLPFDAGSLLSVKQDADAKWTPGLNMGNGAEIARKEQAATKAQAAFRGYLARRAFRALKGIIRLQALVRGHLVRRQAVATLRCMQAIVKFQAVFRGRRVRLSDGGNEMLKRFSYAVPKEAKLVDFLRVDTDHRSIRLSVNAFVRKLLVSLPNAMPLSLQYDSAEPNSVWKWLERWSSACLWEPLSRPKKVIDMKPQRKQANMLVVEMEASKLKRGTRKVPSANGDNNSLHSSDIDKSKRNPRKVIGHHEEHVQDSQNELERVKRNLRKVSASAALVSDKSEVTVDPTKKEVPTEKTEQSERKVSHLHNPGVPEQQGSETTEKMSEPVAALYKSSDLETNAEPLDEPVNMLPDGHPAEEVHFENNLLVNEEQCFREDQTIKVNERTRRRRSFPTKQEYTENISQNSPSVPSYMAATESAKAKLRAQGSPRFAEDGAENGFLRRQSLPSSTIGIVNSVPRMQRQAQANGKAGSKSNLSLSSSRDEKLMQPGWRR